MKLVAMVILSSLFFFGCAGNPHKVEEIDADIDVKGRTGTANIGTNKDGELVVQEDSTAEDELRQTQWANQKLEDDLKSEHHSLKLCRDELSDPRLGGSGEVDSMPEVDNLRNTTQLREQFGLNKKGDLKFVKREYYLDRLKNEREYGNGLKNSIKVIEKNREACERKMGAARVAHGLPAKRYKAQGYFSPNGSWVETRKAENSLDDAFQIKAMEASK